VEASTGSLGHGLPIGCGLALAGRREGLTHRVFVLLSDGELDEGSNWEAILFAGHHQLDNLVAVVDYNKIQSFGSVHEVLDLEPLADKWRACRWEVDVIDGHDHAAIRRSLWEAPLNKGRPVVVLAHTVKGKGVGFMEGRLAWHYKNPDDGQLAEALQELEAGA
jgi:transketolase